MFIQDFHVVPTIWDSDSLEIYKMLVLGVNLECRGIKMDNSQFSSLSSLLSADDLLYLFYHQQGIFKQFVSNTFIFDHRTHAV